MHSYNYTEMTNLQKNLREISYACVHMYQQTQEAMFYTK
jgi:hypothetical protein